MKTPYSIEIPRRALSCALGKEVFAPGMEYYSSLEEDEENGLCRNDYCLECWERSIKQDVLKHALSHWKSKVPTKKEGPAIVDRSERALELLKQALEKNEEEEAFILALYLARQRKLFLRQELKQANGQTISLYEVPETEEMLAVKRLNLSTLQTEKLQVELANKFKKSGETGDRSQETGGGS